MKYIPFLKPSIVKKEAYLKYLAHIDEARYYSNFGPLNSIFEKRVLSEYFNDLGAITTVNNATTALILAISVTKRPDAKYALMPSFTFAATPLAAIWCGLEPYFIDIREDNWCMDEKQVDHALEILGDQVAVIIPYATFGTCLDLTYYDRIQHSKVPVIVDAAPAFGTSGDNGQLGIEFNGMIVFSLHATKPFGIGEGALVYSNRTKIIAQVRRASNFGFSDERECLFPGLNGKLSEYSAAIALATLDKFPQKIQKRNALHKIYFEQFKKNELFEKGWIIQKTSGNIPYQFISVLCPKEISNLDIVRYLEDNSIQSRFYFSPACHQQRAFIDYPRTSMRVTERVSQRIVSLPLWEDMPVEDIATIVSKLKKMEG